MSHTNITGAAADGPYLCPCCGYVTLAARAASEICPVCGWEDDGQDAHDAHEVRGGPNRDLSLSDARRNFATTGACGEHAVPHVRDPLPHEHRDAAPRHGTGTLG